MKRNQVCFVVMHFDYTVCSPSYHISCQVPCFVPFRQAFVHPGCQSVSWRHHHVNHHHYSKHDQRSHDTLVWRRMRVRSSKILCSFKEMDSGTTHVLVSTAAFHRAVAGNVRILTIKARYIFCEERRPKRCNN